MDDRRLAQRFPGKSFVAQYETKMVKIADISVGGLCLIGIDLLVGKTYTIKLIPSNFDNLMLNESVAIDIKITRNESGNSAGFFVKPSYKLMKMIVEHKSHVYGIKPHMVK